MIRKANFMLALGVLTGSSYVMADFSVRPGVFHSNIQLNIDEQEVRSNEGSVETYNVPTKYSNSPGFALDFDYLIGQMDLSAGYEYAKYYQTSRDLVDNSLKRLIPLAGC